MFARFPGLVSASLARRISILAAIMVLATPQLCLAQAAPLDMSASTPTRTQAEPSPAPLPPAGSVSGMGDVNIYPKRIVIDGRQRLGSLGMFNHTASPGEYEIGLSDMMMTSEGQLIELSTVTDEAARARVRTAGSLLRWSPHHVSLAGNEAQTVHIMVRISPDLPPGEYRSHFSVISVPDLSGGLTIDEAAGATSVSGIGVRIVPRFGISVPIIVRVGDTTLTSGLKDLTIASVPDGGKIVSLTITRAGTRSSFGDIAVVPAGSKNPIAQVMGIGVYTEVTERKVQIPIIPKSDPKFYARGARLTVIYTDDDVAPGRVLAKQEFTVP